MAGVLPVGSKIGILGGGQLGRMLALAAAELGFSCAIYCPETPCPAAEVASLHFAADYDDENALGQFAGAVDVVTFEFENVPAKAISFLLNEVPVRPGITALTTAQDRLIEKTFLREHGLPLADFWPVHSEADFDAGLRQLGGAGVLKTCRFGYDGKGQVMLRAPTDPASYPATDRESDRAKALDLLATGAPLVLEALVPFDSEISVIAARGQKGDIHCYEIADNVHQNHILKTSTLPSKLPQDIQQQAIAHTREILTALDYVGVMGAEFFVVGSEKGSQVLVNEIAPRVHNSGHWTQDAAVTSQFEQHIRAICGWPLGDPSRVAPVVMENLIGDDMARIPDLARHPAAKLHLYGKTEVRTGRKMGHVNWIGA